MGSEEESSLLDKSVYCEGLKKKKKKTKKQKKQKQKKMDGRTNFWSSGSSSEKKAAIC